MAATSFGFVTWILLLGMGGAQLPLSLPPLPEDPAMLAAAPQKCLAYLSWAGVAEPKAGTKNQTEQLLAEPEVQQFVHQVETAIVQTIRRNSRGREDTVAAIELPKLVKIALTRPTAIFLEDVKLGNRAPEISAGFVINAGDQAGEAKQSLETLEQLAPPGVVRTVGAWHQTQVMEGRSEGPGKPPRMSPAPDSPIFQWGWKGKYFIFGVGEGTADGIAQRLSGKTPDWLTELHKQLPVERPAMIQYLNVKAISKLVLTQTPVGPHAGEWMKQLGLADLDYFASVTGLEGEGTVTKTALANSGPLSGIFDLAGGEPLTAKDLASIPADATVAMAARLDLAKLHTRSLELAEKIQPGAGQVAQALLGRMEQSLGFSLTDDVLKSLGDSWVVYSSPGEGGLFVTGMTAIVPVRDAVALRKVERKVLDLAERGAGGPAAGRGREPTVRDSQFSGRTIHHITFSDGVPFAPAWCLTDKELIVSLSPQTIKAHLSRPKDAESLASVAEVKRILGRQSNVQAVAYVDTPAFSQVLYPIGQMAYTALCSEAQRNGVELDAAAFPSAAAIRPHLRPQVTVISTTKSEVLLTSESTIPAGFAPLILAAVPLYAVRGASRPYAEAHAASAAAAFVLPGEAQKLHSENNLKQIALAIHNYALAAQKLPCADGAAKTGKPTLSWRVRLLPYLEQAQLYNEFHLDEPWDSEHNKTLIARMPPIYAAPGSKAAAEHKTVYLTPRGKDTMFPAGKELRFSDITDGLSNTLMVVEANDERAVTWTKPDDYEVDWEKPSAGLIGLRNNCFLAAFGDGSVRAFSAKLDSATLKALFTRARGEPIPPLDP